MKKTSILIIAVAVIIAVAAGLRATGLLTIPGIPASGKAAAAAASATPPPVPVTVARVLEKSVTEWDEFSGRVRAIDSVQIRPQISGIIEQIHFSDSQLVHKGDMLFTIDPRPFQAVLAHAQADLLAAQSKVALAQTNLKRNQQLIESHAIAQSELDVTNDAFLEAQASEKATEAAIQTAQLNLNYTSITAPVTGRVSRAEITVGNLVNDGVNAPVLTTLVSISPVYVEFEVDEQTYLKYLANGANGNTGVEHLPVQMGLANEDGYPRQGRVESLDNQLDTTSGTIRVRAVFDDPNGELTPGLYAKVRTGGSAAETAILVDDRAVGTDQDKKFVMVVDENNKANYRMITLGPIVDGLRVVLSGLQKGERIVVNGLQRVRPNTIVDPTEVTMDRSQQNSSAPDLTAAAK
jgi:multidrug efflux system membrane fusion protein